MIAIQQEVARDLRLRKSEKRQNEDLRVPEDMSTIAKATESFCANTHILVVTGRSDQELEDHVASSYLCLVIANNLHIRVRPIGGPGLRTRPQEPIIGRPLFRHLG